jgi:hypothetical protein
VRPVSDGTAQMGCYTRRRVERPSANLVPRQRLKRMSIGESRGRRGIVSKLDRWLDSASANYVVDFL